MLSHGQLCASWFIEWMSCEVFNAPLIILDKEFAVFVAPLPYLRQVACSSLLIKIFKRTPKELQLPHSLCTHNLFPLFLPVFRYLTSSALWFCLIFCLTGKKADTNSDNIGRQLNQTSSHTFSLLLNSSFIQHNRICSQPIICGAFKTFSVMPFSLTATVEIRDLTRISALGSFHSCSFWPGQFPVHEPLQAFFPSANGCKTKYVDIV